MKACDEDKENYYEEKIDKWLASKGIEQNRLYKRLNKYGSIKEERKTLPTLIRNIIHHPENINNLYSALELEESIKAMIEVVRTGYKE